VAESSVVRLISQSLDSEGRYYVNLSGSSFSRSGHPDFLTNDSTGLLLGIEAKDLGKQPAVSQWRRLIEVLKSGGRAIVAYDDYEFSSADIIGKLPTYEIGSEIGVDDFKAELPNPRSTVEIILKRDSCDS
jgi:hypothetical protein